MPEEKVQLDGREADAYIIPLGRVNLVAVVSNGGMVGCGAFNIGALDRFACPAATVKSPIVTAEDVLNGEVNAVNKTAEGIGVKPGMSGKEALECM